MDNRPKLDLLGKIIESLAKRISPFLALVLLLIVILTGVYVVAPEVFSNWIFWVLVVILSTFAFILQVVWKRWGNGGKREKAGKKIPQSDDVVTTLNFLTILLREGKLADASRLYIDLIKHPEPQWQSSETSVKNIWDKNAPGELKVITELWLSRPNSNDAKSCFGHSGDVKISLALQWALNTLDDDWEQKVRELTKQFYRAGLLSSPEATKIVKRMMREDLRAVLRPWLVVTFHKESKASIPDDIRLGLDFLGLQGNPFGAERAEKDMCLFDAYYPHLPALKEVREKSPAIIFGKAGSGKTAAALWLVSQGIELRGQPPSWFPVYCPTTTEPDISVIAHAVAETLLCYLAINPSAFTNLRTSNRQSIVHLWVNSMAVGDELIVRLREARMPLTGAGAEMEKNVRRLMKGISRANALTVDEYLRLLDSCRPYGFESVRVFLDWNLKTPSEAIIPLTELSTQLANVGIFVSAFVLGAVSGKSRTRLRDEYPVVNLIQFDWDETHLREFLRIRLAQCGEDSIASWCNPLARRPDPDGRLIQAAGSNTPQGIIRKGNALLRRIGEKQALLSQEDLDKPLPP